MNSRGLWTAILALVALASCDYVSPSSTSDGYKGPPPPPVDASVTLADQSIDVPFALPDPAHVDLQVIAQQAQDIARNYEPDAWLSHAYATKETMGGNVDLTLGGMIGYQFAYKTVDPAAPPGRDKAEGHIVVEIRAKPGDAKPGATAHVWRDRIPMSSSQGEDRPRALPLCTVGHAWAKVVETDVPANSVATLRYGGAFNDPSVFVWSFRVAGHDELNREIDGDTCERVKLDNAALVAREMARSRAEAQGQQGVAASKAAPRPENTTPKPLDPSAPPVADPFK